MKYLAFLLFLILTIGCSENSTEVIDQENNQIQNSNIEIKSSSNIDFGSKSLNLDTIIEGNDTYVIFYGKDDIIEGISGIFNSLISLPFTKAVVDQVEGGIKFTYSDGTCDVFGVADQLIASQISGCNIDTSGIGVSLYPLYAQSERLHIDTLYAQYNPSEKALGYYIADFYNFDLNTNINDDDEDAEPTCLNGGYGSSGCSTANVCETSCDTDYSFACCNVRCRCLRISEWDD